jgi:hypothetical protein
MNDKENIEKAIEEINGFLIDFGEAAGSLRSIRELLYSLIEEPEAKDEN